MRPEYTLPIDPERLTHDPVVDLDAANISAEAAEFFAANDYETKIAPLLDRIPAREADIIELSVLRGSWQRDIATIFGLTQQAVSYRLERAIRRLKFLLAIPQVSEEELRRDLPEVFPSTSPCTLCCCRSAPKKGKTAKAPPALPGPGEACRVCHDQKSILIDVEVLVGMWRTTCLSAVAKHLGLTLNPVRKRFAAALEILREAAENAPHLQPYAKVFAAIRANPLALYEFILPQWAERGKDECF